jgi:hypothetical protein
MNHRRIILNFVYKFFCILKAASDGWIIKYIGGNQFEFISYKNPTTSSRTIDINKVLKQYSKKLPSIITNIV